jgi:medium-chain acyl-[acyl-carrier-protein] hydrolase
VFPGRAVEAAVDSPSLRGFGSRKETARLRLYTFHHAGGSASSYLWREYFGDDVEICAIELPGREGRLLEAPFTSMSTAAGSLAAEIRSTVDLPYAFFGHGMGALVAYDVARRLRDAGIPPGHLFLSAYRAPQLPNREPDSALSNECLFTVGEVALDGEMRDLYRPVVGADFTLCGTYRYTPAAPLPCPITVFGGRDDHVVSEFELRAWRAHTSREFTVKLFPGGHFYLRDAERAVTEHIRSALPVPAAEELRARQA